MNYVKKLNDSINNVYTPSKLDKVSDKFGKELEYEEKLFKLQQQLQSCFLLAYNQCPRTIVRDQAAEALQIPYGNLRAFRFYGLKISQLLKWYWPTKEGLAIAHSIDSLIKYIELR